MRRARRLTNILWPNDDSQLLNKIHKTLVFPLLILDIEAYHFKKDSSLHDYLKSCHGKPFLLGTCLINSYEELQTKPLEQLCQYRYHLNWKINDKKLKPLRSFATFLNQTVSKYKVQSFMIADPTLEVEIFSIMKKRRFLNFSFQNIVINDLYTFFNLFLLKQEDVISANNNISVKQYIDKLLTIDLEYQTVKKLYHEDVNDWESIWRGLDNLYSYDAKNQFKNLDLFQKQYFPVILTKNYNDILTILAALKILTKAKGK